MFNFKFSWCLLSTVVEVQGRYLQIKKEILIFKVPVIFKNENFAMQYACTWWVNILQIF